MVFRWSDEKSARVTYDMAPDEIFDESPEWLKVFLDGYSDGNAAFVSIAASDPRITSYNVCYTKLLRFYSL